MSEKISDPSRFNIEAKEKDAAEIKNEYLKKKVRTSISPFIDNFCPNAVDRLTNDITRRVMDLRNNSAEKDNSDRRGIGIVYHQLSEEEAHVGAKILEWILGVNNSITNYFVRNYQNTPIFGSLKHIHKLLTTDKVYEEGSEGKGQVIRIDEFSIKIFILAINETIDYLEDLGRSNDSNPYRGYLSILKEYRTFLEESETLA